jgi:CHAT domain-containing protein
MSRRVIPIALLIAVGASSFLRPVSDADAVDPRLEAAIALYRADGAEKALGQFVRLASEFRAARLRADERTAIHYIGESHWRLGQFDEARRHLEQALAMNRKAGDRLGEGKTLNVLGLLDWDLGSYNAALKHFQSASTIGRDLGDKRLEGTSLNNLSLVYDELGRYDVSLRQYHRVLELYRDADFPRGEGDTLGNIGGVYLLLGRFREALPYYERALAISQRLESKPSQSQDHGNVALCLLGLGDVDEAMRHFDRAIDLARQAGMRQDEAYWLMGQANGVMQQGRYDLALRYHREALGIYERIEAKAEFLEALHQLGRLHLLLGDLDSAERDFRRALALAREIGLPRGVTRNLLALGDLQYRVERLDAAASLYAEAKHRAENAREQHHVAESALRLARVDRKIGRNADAEREIDRALVIAREIQARPLEAEARYARADLDRLRGRLRDALTGFDQAQELLADTGDPALLWQIHYGRALAFEATGNDPAAIRALTAAVKLIEGVRNRLQERRFRAGYVEDKYEVYIDLVRLQLGQGQTAEAFHTAERLRARSYAEQLGDRPLAPLHAQDRRKENELRERIRQLQRALVQDDLEGRPVHRQEARKAFSRELLTAEQGYQSFLDDRIRRSSATSRPATATVADIQAKLHQTEALVDYIVGRDASVVFVITAGGISARTLPVRRAELAARVGLLRDLIRQPATDRWLKPASSLSATLIQPIQDQGLLRGIRHLYVVPHGVLNFLPFSLLPFSDFLAEDESAKLLVDEFALSQLPAAAALLAGVATAHDGPASMLAVSPSRSRLRFAPAEVRSIEAMFKPHSRLLVGSGATEGQFKRLAGSYRVVHVATHGSFNRNNPLLSGLELEADEANDGLLQVHEVLELELDADLVTLSACDTALGSGHFAEVPAGDELVGITRAFLAAGSESVLATLWEVDDRASVRFMQRFYEQLIATGSPRDIAESLVRAQRELRATRTWHHPYYWAPFVLIGTDDQTGPARLQVEEKST